MKNKGLIITLIILLSIIIFFLVMFLVVYLRGGISFRNGFINIGTKSTKIIFDQQFTLEDIKNIKIKQDTGDVIFKEGTNDHIQVLLYGENENDAKVNLNNGTLDIDNTHKRNFIIFNLGETKKDIIIYIPSSYSNEIKINNDYGKCEIPDLKNATVDIECDCGNVQIDSIADAKIKCDYGNVEIKEILNKCDIKADCGNIEIDTLSIKENSTINADLGNVDISKTNDIYIEANVDLGKANINTNNRNAEITLKINCDCGNITINN